MLRKHQKEFTEVVRRIIAGEAIRRIVVDVTPGGGKSLLPVLACELITAGVADKICWIVPRSALQDQAERNFIDPLIKKISPHTHVIRSATNDSNPSRGLTGFVTTYQALGADSSDTVLEDFKQHRYLLVLDEYHHAQESGGVWAEKITPLYNSSTIAILMTGTLERGDQHKIAFTSYDERGYPVFNQSDTALIRYGRSSAIADGAILPIRFFLRDGDCKWYNCVSLKQAKLSMAKSTDQSHSLYTALSTGYAEELIDIAIAHWLDYRVLHPTSKILFVAPDIETGGKYLDYIRRTTGIDITIATSADTPQAREAIQSFKTSCHRGVTSLMTVAMAYEGLDVPAISHVVALTHIRSAPWIKQMVARGVRIDPAWKQSLPGEEQLCFVFAPSDQKFLQVQHAIEHEQTLAIKTDGGLQPAEKGMKVEGEARGSRNPFGITPLESALLKTQHDLEIETRKEIENHVRAYAACNRIHPKHVNSEVSAVFGKKRDEMSLRELQRVSEYVKNNYIVREELLRSENERSKAINCDWKRPSAFGV